MPDSRILSLADAGLDVVPGLVYDPLTGQEDPTWRARHFAWYENVRDWRAWAQKKFARDREFRKKILLLCERDCALFVTLFLDIEEPRSMEYFDPSGVGLDDALAGLHDPNFQMGTDDLSYRTIHPFIPFAYQVEAWRVLTYVILGPLRPFYHDVLWDKARGIGMSYAFLAWAYWAWTFIPGLRGTILTEKWDKAERSKDLNSLFGKLDLFLDATPDILVPTGYKEKGSKDANRVKGSLTNPENGAAIFTEPTTQDSTRGGREAYVGVDEINFHEYLDETWATAGGTTKHRIGWSSASYRFGRQGERKFKSAKEHPRAATVYTLDWNENPHQGQQWYEQERERFRAAGQEEQFEVEYLRNASAGSGRLVYKKQLDLVTWTDAGYDPSRPLNVSVDPGTDDATAFVMWQTHYTSGKKVVRWVEACELRQVPVQFWTHVMTGIPPRGAWTDAQGVLHEPDEAYKYLLEGFFELGHIPRVMTFMATVPPHAIRLVGDPAMRSRDVTNQSWISYFQNGTLELRQREFGANDARAIPIYCNLPWEVLNKRNNFQDRRSGMRQSLMLSEFYRHSPGVLEMHESLANTLFQETTERSTRAPGHIHDLGSNYVQAAEYGMTWEMLDLTPAEIIPPRVAAGEERTRRSSARPVRSNYQRAKRNAQRDALARLF